MNGPERLADLFLGLFDNEAAFRRFLALYRFQAPAALPPGATFRTLAAQAAETLMETGQINAALFDALTARSPDRRADISEVARFYGVGDEPSPVSGGTDIPGDEVPPELADFARQLLSDFGELQVPDELARVMDHDYWPWAAVAAVLGSFQPTALRPLPGPAPRDSALVALADFIFVSFDGSWVLQREFRVPCLQRLRDQGNLDDAIAANRGLPDAHRDLVDSLARGRRPALARLDTASLATLAAVIDWLEPVLGSELPVSGTEVGAVAERRLLLDPLRALTGQHFRGRAKELSMIGDHIKLRTPWNVLCIQGPGGIGKSSLMGRVLLDLEDGRAFADNAVSYVYIDFDRARHDPHDPIGLLEQMARQLRLLYATAAEVSSEFAGLESVSAGTDLDYAAELLQISRSPSLSEMVSALAQRLLEVRDRYNPGAPSLVVALDTFEEVQSRGPGAIYNVRDLISRLQQALPDMRVLVSGRGVVREFTDDRLTSIMRLGDLAAEDAESLLESLGVADPALREQIVMQFGSSPLTLHLAARALIETDSDEDPFDAVIAQADALAKVSLELVQGVLYRRILGHIADPDVVKVAYPGLAVRRITIDVLRDVLAGPCDFDPARAEAIFVRLQRDVAMFDLEDRDTLLHRPDVRRLMLRMMRDDPRQTPVVKKIHELAAEYYGSKDGDVSRAEEIYHRLMAGDDTRALSRRWDPKLNPLLASALEEPLPPRARTWLGRRLGLVAGDERDTWDQEDWEDDAASRVSSWLNSGLPSQALGVLSERSVRLAGSRLFALEVAAHLALDNLSKAGEALDRGLRDAIDVGDHGAQLELLEAAIKVRARQGDGPGVVEAVRSAVALTSVTGEPYRAIEVLTSAVGVLQELGLDDEVAALNAEIARRFARLSRSDMREQPELVRRVLYTAGPTDSGVLVHAAAEVGDLSKESDPVFYEDSLILQRLLNQTSNTARPAIAELATEVGLPKEGWDLGEVTSRAVRFGRAGKVIALGLDYARDDQQARQFVVDNLVRPRSREGL